MVEGMAVGALLYGAYVVIVAGRGTPLDFWSCPPFVGIGVAVGLFLRWAGNAYGPQARGEGAYASGVFWIAVGVVLGAALSYFLRTWLYLPVFSALGLCSKWVHTDAVRRGMSPLWALGVFVLTIVFLPWYLLVRVDGQGAAGEADER